MILLAAGLSYLAVLILGGIVLITRSSWQVWHPRLALLAWHAAALSCVVALFCGIAHAVQVALSYSLAHHHDGIHQTICTLACWLGLFLLGGAAALVASQSEPVLRDEYAQRAHLCEVIGRCRQHVENRADVTVRHLADDTPLACSFRSPEPTVIVTRGLENQLTETEFQAVIEHERAHLIQRHDLLILLSLLAVACLPGFALARRFERSSRLLVELIADDFAARRWGRETVSTALAKLAEAQGNPALLARSNRLRRAPMPRMTVAG